MGGLLIETTFLQCFRWGVRNIVAFGGLGIWGMLWLMLFVGFAVLAFGTFGIAEFFGNDWKLWLRAWIMAAIGLGMILLACFGLAK